MIDLENLDSDFQNLSDDEPSHTKMRRYKKPKMDYWAKEIIQRFSIMKGKEIKNELQSEMLDFLKIENYFKSVNHKIINAGTELGVSPT